jgi:hypothetical protein
VAGIERGGDECVVGVVRGPVIQSFDAFRENDLMQTVKRIHDKSLELGFASTGRTRPSQEEMYRHRARCTIDDVGLGGGVTDRCRELGMNITAFNGAQRADNPERYANRRAESYFLLREKADVRANRIP